MLINLNFANAPRSADFPFRIVRAGVFEQFHPRKMARFYHDTEICLRIGASVREESDVLDDIPYRTAFPHAICKHIDRSHCFEGEGTREGFFFIYAPDVSERLEKAGFLRDFFIQPFVYDSVMIAFASEFRDCIMRSEEHFSADRLDMLGLRILQELLIRRLNAGKPPDLPEERIRRAASWIRVHPESRCDAAELAKRFGFSERGFFRHWKAVFPQSPGIFLLEVKLRHAAYLLAHTKNSVMSIAAMLGFCDDNYFSNCFRRYAGKTPRRYRADVADPYEEDPFPGEEP